MENKQVNLKPEHFFDTKNCKILSYRSHSDGRWTGLVSYLGVKFNCVVDSDGFMEAERAKK